VDWVFDFAPVFSWHRWLLLSVLIVCIAVLSYNV
jgi:hypothetical protein